MPGTELDRGADTTHHPSWWKRLLMGAFAGGFFGALEIWFYEFSLVRLLAAILSGASFFAIVGLLAVKFGKDRSKLIAVTGFAGLVAGIVYWVVARPSSSPVLAVGIGVVGGIIYAWAESRG
jgi:hypothetical protein